MSEGEFTVGQGRNGRAEEAGGRFQILPPSSASRVSKDVLDL